MRDYVLLYVNGQRTEVRGRDVFLSLSDFARRRLGLIGTKIVCSEGDCGACTALIGRPRDSRIKYQAVDSCIQFLFQLDGTHVVTVEGLSRDAQLNCVQQSLVDCHGSQCGFCTPGFVVAMTGMLEESRPLTEPDLRYGLTGNLCRCTGYTSILDAGTTLAADGHDRLEEIHPVEEICRDLTAAEEQGIEVCAQWDDQTHRVACPVHVEAALEFLAAHPQATVVAGATDVGVRINKSRTVPRAILDLNRVGTLDRVEVQEDQLSIGARASWTAIESACRDLLPEFHRVLTVFGSPQIRNVGTIGGNIVNASPIADSLPLLFVMEATLGLRSVDGPRKVNINDFYRGYKQFDLRPGELLTDVQLPLPSENELLRLYKVSRRRDLDISSFTAAVRMRLDGDVIEEVRIAFGAVGPTVLRATATEDFLRGREFTEETMRQAGDVAVGEVTPISDVRGSADYRLQLTRNVLLKFFHQHQPEMTPA